MSHTRVKTKYAVEASYGGTDYVDLYCHHNHSCDYITYYDEDGNIVDMQFHSWVTDNDLWDAMNRLWFPYKDEWGGELKDGVEYYGVAPWEEKDKTNNKNIND